MATAFDDIPAAGSDPFGDIPSKYAAPNAFSDLPDTGGYVATVKQAAKEAGKAALAKPQTIPGGLGEALTAGIGSTAGAFASGWSGLSEGLASLIAGKGFAPGFEAGMAQSERRQEPGQKLFEPETEFGKRGADVLSAVIPGGIKAGGEKVFEKTGSPEAAAGTVAGGTLLSMLFPGGKRLARGAVGDVALPPRGMAPGVTPRAAETPALLRPKPEPSPAPAAAEAAKPNVLADSVVKTFAPAARGTEALQTAGIMRQNAGQLARDTQVAHERLAKFGEVIDRLPEQSRYDFIDAIETGGKQTDSRLQPAADAMRQMLDERRTTVQSLGTGALENFIEDYFPHIWKEPGKVADAMEQAARKEFGKRPLKGPESFLRQRTIPTTKEGLAAGLEPVSSNPIDLTLLKIREMDRFVMGTRVMREMKDTGLAQFVGFGKAPPEGWIKIEDKAARALQWDEEAKGFVLRGHYYAPEPAATIINNYLQPGIAGVPLYQAIRGAGNMLNMMQLGFSAFHAGFTTFDAMVSKTALGIKQLAQGNFGEGLTNLAKGTLLTEAVANVWRGEKLNRAYKNPGTGGPLLESIVDGLVAAGGRIKMDQFYNATRAGSYWDSLINKRFINDFTRRGVARGAIEFFPRLVQTISAPIMEWLVPRQKLGVFSDLMKNELQRYPNMTPEEMRVRAGKLWDSVDNRLGELVYDNLFWNKTVKDLSFLAVRSVGWNLGTIREIGGGALDWMRQARSGLGGQGFQMTDRMAYVAALPVVTGLYGAVIQYLYTGNGPQELKDYFFPKTGRDTKEGFPERLNLPTYMKDVVEYYHAPGQTVVNKMNPLIGVVNQMYRNEDFYGAQIRDLDADALKQTEQVLTYLARQMLPFSARGFQRQAEEGAPTGQAALSFFGLNPSPAFITRPPEVEKAIERIRDRPAIRKRLREEQKAQQE